MELLAGHLLIAPPCPHDPDFAKAVLLLIQHSADQAVGLVLNRPATRVVSEVSGKRGSCNCREPIYAGGPVPGPVMALHGDPSLAEIEVLPGLYYAVQKKNLEKLLRQTGQPFRVFDSHAGWGPGQLERLLEPDGWSVMPATRQLVFDAGPSLWDEVAKAVYETASPPGGNGHFLPHVGVGITRRL